MAWLAGWANRKAIAVQDAYVDGDLTDFPLYVPVIADADMATALATGFDLRFTLSDGTTLLSYERESWAGGGGGAVTADIWVKVPSIEAAGGASIYLYWGKTGAVDGASPANVWDANHKGVWHSQDASNTTIADSTVNANTGTKKGIGEPAEAAGKIDQAQSLDGTDDYVYFGDTDDLDLNPTGFTVSAWIKGTDDIGQVLSKYHVYPSEMGWELMTHTHFAPHKQCWRVYNTEGGNNQVASSASIDDDNWHHIVGVFDVTHNLIYVDSAVDSVDYDGTPSTSTPYHCMLGGRDIWGGHSVSWGGLLDEVRISNIARSAEWIKFEFRNIDEGDNELDWGALEAPPLRVLSLIGATSSRMDMTGATSTRMMHTGRTSTRQELTPEMKGGGD